MRRGTGGEGREGGAASSEARSPAAPRNGGTPAGPGVADEKLRRAEAAISAVLRTGVTLSVGTIAAGLAMMFAHHPAYRSISGNFSYHRLTSVSTPFPHTFAQLGASLAAGQGKGIVVLGVLLLILTPVARVAVSVVAFVSERDAAMTGVTLFVLAALVASFLLGGGLG